jgi:hypothetical protein
VSWRGGRTFGRRSHVRMTRRSRHG